MTKSPEMHCFNFKLGKIQNNTVSSLVLNLLTSSHLITLFNHHSVIWCIKIQYCCLWVAQSFGNNNLYRFSVFLMKRLRQFSCCHVVYIHLLRVFCKTNNVIVLASNHGNLNLIRRWCKKMVIKCIFLLYSGELTGYKVSKDRILTLSIKQK